MKGSGKIKVGVLLRNGWAGFGLVVRHDVPGGVACDPVAEQDGAAGCELGDLLFVVFEVSGKLVRIFLDELDGDVLDVSLSDVSQAYHPVGGRVCPHVI